MNRMLIDKILTNKKSKEVVRSLHDFLVLKPFYSQLWFQFWWMIFLLSLATAVIYALIVAKVWVGFVNTSSQYVNWEVASNVASLIKESESTLDSRNKIQSRLKDLNSFYPAFDIYLYNPKTKELLSRESRKSVEINTIPFDSFTENPKNIKLPLEIESSYFEGLEEDDDYPYSAAPMFLHNQKHYVIIILGGKNLVNARRNIESRHLKSLGNYLFWSILSISCILGLFVIFLLPRRLNKMTKIVGEFRSGNYSNRIRDNSGDELGDYARAFDQMADQIVENLKRLESQDDIRRQLIANVSHELRRPLTVLNLSLETLLDKDAASSFEQRTNYINQSISCGENLSSLVDDLFELSKLEANESSLRAEKFFINNLLSEISQNFSEIAFKKGVKLSLVLPEDQQIPFIGDEDLLEKAISNLIENAIEHSKEKQLVEVKMSLEDEKISISVHDQGSGISKEELPNIFKRFYRGKENSSEGAGLGLAIANRIIELHNSNLIVSSELGKGSVFSFDLLGLGGA